MPGPMLPSTGPSAPVGTGSARGDPGSRRKIRSGFIGRALVRRREIEEILRREADDISEDKICRGRATKKSPDLVSSQRVAAGPRHFFVALLRQPLSLGLPASRFSNCHRACSQRAEIHLIKPLLGRKTPRDLIDYCGENVEEHPCLTLR